MSAIPKDVATQLCNDIRRESRYNRRTLWDLMCWGCHKFSRGDPDKKCFSNQPDYRGCFLVNARYDKQLRAPN